MCTPSTKYSRDNGHCPHTPAVPGRRRVSAPMPTRSDNAARRAPKNPPRTASRPGDLRRALIDAGTDLARSGGPDAVVLREATRRAGVVPNAAYRHFASRHDLLQAVRSAALSSLAVAMEKDLARLRRGRQGADSARAGLRAIG